MEKVQLTAEHLAQMEKVMTRADWLRTLFSAANKVKTSERAQEPLSIMLSEVYTGLAQALLDDVGSQPERKTLAEELKYCNAQELEILTNALAMARGG